MGTSIACGVAASTDAAGWIIALVDMPHIPVTVIQALADVFRSDKNVSVLEVDFFDKVAEALHVTPSQVAGLVAGDVD